MLDADERRRARRSKLRTDAAGRQHAEWPDAFRDAMTAAGLTEADPDELSKARLARYARALDVRGRSRMRKAELARAVAEAEPASE